MIGINMVHVAELLVISVRKAVIRHKTNTIAQAGQLDITVRPSAIHLDNPDAWIAHVITTISIRLVIIF